MTLLSKVLQKHKNSKYNITTGRTGEDNSVNEGMTEINWTYT